MSGLESRFLPAGDFRRHAAECRRASAQPRMLTYPFAMLTLTNLFSTAVSLTKSILQSPRSPPASEDRAAVRRGLSDRRELASSYAQLILEVLRTLAGNNDGLNLRPGSPE